MSKYILDTNVLISAYRLKYPMDVIPSFWDRLLEIAEDHVFALIDLVIEEINKGEDELKRWIDENLESIDKLNSDDRSVIEAYTEIIEDVTNDPQYFDSAKNFFADCADSWIIAHALAYDYIVVTEEVFSKGVKRRVKIPNVCQKFSIRYITTIEFLRQIGIKI